MAIDPPHEFRNDRPLSEPVANPTCPRCGVAGSGTIRTMTINGTTLDVYDCVNCGVVPFPAVPAVLPDPGAPTECAPVSVVEALPDVDEVCPEEDDGGFAV